MIQLQGESKKTGISKILNFVWGPLKCTKLNFYPMHIFSPLRDIWFNGITMDFSFKNEWVIAIWKFWDPSFFWLTLYFRPFVFTNAAVETTKIHSILNPSMILISALLNPQLDSCFNLDMESFYLKEYQVTDLQCVAQWIITTEISQ